MVAVVVEGLRKSYGGNEAVRDITLAVDEGEIVGILGPNGSGKTTTVECIQGLRRPDAGRIDVLGVDPRHDERAIRRLVGSQLQDSALPDRIKVWEALSLFATLRTGGPDWQVLLEQWDLGAQRNTAFADLSGGQRQRLLVALALVNDPPIVFLDEMTTGLDPAARRVAWDLIAALRERGTTVVLVTHFMDEAERLCDRLYVVGEGRVLADGTPRDLIDRFTDEVVVRFGVDTQDVDLGWIERMPGATSITHEAGEVAVIGTGPLLARVAHGLVERGLEPPDLRVDLPTLEDVYLRLTGSAGKDA